MDSLVGLDGSAGSVIMTSIGQHFRAHAADGYEYTAFDEFYALGCFGFGFV